MGLSPSELEMSSEEMGELLDVSTLAIFATWFLFRLFWCCLYYGNGSLVGFYSHLFLYSPFLLPIRFLLFRYISTFFLFRLFLLRFILSLAFEDTCTFAVANAIECLSDILLHVNPFVLGSRRWPWPRSIQWCRCIPSGFVELSTLTFVLRLPLFLRDLTRSRI